MHFSKKNLINKYQNKYILDISTVLHRTDTLLTWIVMVVIVS